MNRDRPSVEKYRMFIQLDRDEIDLGIELGGSRPRVPLLIKDSEHAYLHNQNK
jgi:hypothetical protein